MHSALAIGRGAARQRMGRTTSAGDERRALAARRSHTSMAGRVSNAIGHCGERVPRFCNCAAFRRSEKHQSPHWGLNPGPSVYKTDALPLSYRGNWCEVRALHLAQLVASRRFAGAGRPEQRETTPSQPPPEGREQALSAARGCFRSRAPRGLRAQRCRRGRDPSSNARPRRIYARSGSTHRGRRGWRIPPASQSRGHARYWQAARGRDPCRARAAASRPQGPTGKN